MELYSIVKVCKEFDVPIVAYKWVSDDGEASDWKENAKIGYKKFQEEFLIKSYERNTKSKNAV